MSVRPLRRKRKALVAPPAQEELRAADGQAAAEEAAEPAVAVTASSEVDPPAELPAEGQ